MRKKKKSEGNGFNVWRSYSDMMAGVLLLFVLIMCVTLFQAQKSYNESLQERDEKIAMQEQYTQELLDKQNAIDEKNETLQNQDEHQKPQRLDRRVDQDDKKRWDGADKRPEIRNDVCHADDHRDKHRARHAKQRHPDEAQDSDDQRIQNFSTDKAAKHVVCLRREVKNPIGILFWQDRVPDLFDAGAEPLLIHQHIDGDDNANDNCQ